MAGAPAAGLGPAARSGVTFWAGLTLRSGSTAGSGWLTGSGLTAPLAAGAATPLSAGADAIAGPRPARPAGLLARLALARLALARLALARLALSRRPGPLGADRRSHALPQLIRQRWWHRWGRPGLSRTSHAVRELFAVILVAHVEPLARCAHGTMRTARYSGA